MTLDEIREIALSFPGVEEGTSYGHPSFVVNKKFFTRLRRDDANACCCWRSRSTSVKC